MLHSKTASSISDEMRTASPLSRLPALPNNSDGRDLNLVKSNFCNNFVASPHRPRCHSQSKRIRRCVNDFSDRYHVSKRSRSSCADSISTLTSSSTTSSVCCFRRRCSDLPLEWWERSEGCKRAKSLHTERIDRLCDSREDLVLLTTLWQDDIVLEPNMFPYDTPWGIEHYTLWSTRELDHEEVVAFVDRWLAKNMPNVRRWQYDDNSGRFHLQKENVPTTTTNVEDA
eukprot:scaffold2727_cov161-Ochromonas_danica.AAC.9